MRPILFSLKQSIFVLLLLSPFVNSCKKETSQISIPIAANIPIIDPCMIRQNGTYHLFGTGGGLTEWTSSDMKSWKAQEMVFAKIPSWISREIPDFAGDLWAPDISYYNGQYYMFYCASVMGENESVIGVATNKTLDHADPLYQWVDHGMLFRSYQNKTTWNALDPNLITDDQGNPYLAFGSFWQGLKIVKLSQDRLSVAEDPDSVPIIASRNDQFADHVFAMGPLNNAIEGSFIFKKDSYYYLFASIDYCCRAGNSNYKIVVGRSKTINGNYEDQEGRPMLNDGSTLVRAGDENWTAVGHNAVCNFDGTDYLIYFGYDANDNYKQKLRIEKLNWTKNGFPVVVATD